MKKILTLLFLLTASISVLADANQFLSTQGGTYKRLDNLSDYNDGNILILASHSTQSGEDKIRIMRTVSSTIGRFDSFEYGSYNSSMPDYISLVSVNSSTDPYEYYSKKEGSPKTPFSISLNDINDKYFGTENNNANNKLTLSNSLSSYTKWTTIINEFKIRESTYNRWLACDNSVDHQDNGLFTNIGTLTNYNVATVYKKIHSLTIGSTGYATLYYEHNDLILPAGLTAFTYDLEDGKLARKNITKGKADGTVRIPHGTAVMIKGEPGTYELDILAKNVATGFTGNNLLSGTDTQALTTGDNCLFYFLANGSNGLGFYYGAADGAAFLNNAHKAYLCIPTGSSTKMTFFSIEDDNTTGANEIKNDAPAATTKCYDLSGRQITEPSRGLLYIKGGKKYSR